MDVTDFLLARIAEDEAAAAAATGGRWVPDTGTVRADGTVAGEPLVVAAGYGSIRQVDLDHIARHDPARVLAGCDAKRAIVDNHRRHLPGASGYGASRYAVAQLAACYADHPDYEPRWLS